MKKAVLYLFFLFFVSFVFGQNNFKLDSLKRVLVKLPKEGRSFAIDTLRVKVLCEIGEEYGKKKNDSTLYYRKEALNTSIKTNYKKGKVKSYILLGNYYSSQALSIKGTENYLKALAIAEELNLIDEQIKLTAEIGSDYLSLSDFKQSYFYFKKHSELCKKHGSEEDYALSINHLGILFFDQRKFREALKYFLECESWSKKTGKPKLINAALINVGKVYVELNRYDDALIRYKRALKIEDGYLDKTAFVNNEMATIYFQKKEFNEALNRAKLALVNTNASNKTMLKNVSLTLSKVYEKLGDEKEAFKHYKIFTDISLYQDSVKNSQLVRFMNLDYQSEKQLFQIEGLNTEVKIKENQNRLLMISIIGTLLIMISILFFYFSIKKKNNFIEKQKAEIQDLNQNLELKIKERTEELSEANKELIKKNFEITEALFKGQTIERKRVAAELHDNLGSTLSAIKWRLGALDEGNLNPKEQEIYKGIKAMMANAYDDVRNISHNLMPAEFEKYGIEGALQKVIREINENGKIQIEFKSEGDLSKIDNKIALELYSISMELINNILKHSEATFGNLLIKRKDEKLTLKVSDNGKGIKGKINYGNGLLNLKERVRMLGGTFVSKTYGEGGLITSISLTSKE